MPVHKQRRRHWPISVDFNQQKLTHSLSYSRVIRTDWPELLIPKYREGIGYSILLHAKLVVFYLEKQLFQSQPLSRFFFLKVHRNFFQYIRDWGARFALSSLAPENIFGHSKKMTDHQNNTYSGSGELKSAAEQLVYSAATWCFVRCREYSHKDSVHRNNCWEQDNLSSYESPAPLQSLFTQGSATLLGFVAPFS